MALLTKLVSLRQFLNLRPSKIFDLDSGSPTPISLPAPPILSSLTISCGLLHSRLYEVHILGPHMSRSRISFLLWVALAAITDRIRSIYGKLPRASPRARPDNCQSGNGAALRWPRLAPSPAPRKRATEVLSGPTEVGRQIDKLPLPARLRRLSV
jgi:hypothetical protein